MDNKIEMLQYWIWEHASKYQMLDVLKCLNVTYSIMDLPTSWIDAWTISKVMAEGLKYEQVSSELLKHIQEILTSLVKHYGSILKQLNCIKIVHIMKFIILCKAANVVKRLSTSKAQWNNGLEVLFPKWDTRVWNYMCDTFNIKESWAITKIKEGVKVFYNKRRKQLLERETQNLFEDLQIGIGRYFPSIILALNKIQLSTLEKIQCNRRILEQNLQFVNKLLEDEITSNSLIKLITELNDMHLKNQLSELQTLIHCPGDDEYGEIIMNTEVYTWRPLTEFEHEELGMRLSCTESFPDLPTDMMVETENGLENITLNRDIPLSRKGAIVQPHWFCSYDADCLSLKTLKTEKDDYNSSRQMDNPKLPADLQETAYSSCSATDSAPANAATAKLNNLHGKCESAIESEKILPEKERFYQAPSAVQLVTALETGREKMPAVEPEKILSQKDRFYQAPSAVQLVTALETGKEKMSPSLADALTSDSSNDSSDPLVYIVGGKLTPVAEFHKETGIREKRKVPTMSSNSEPKQNAKKMRTGSRGLALSVASSPSMEQHNKPTCPEVDSVLSATVSNLQLCSGPVGTASSATPDDSFDGEHANPTPKTVLRKPIPREMNKDCQPNDDSDFQPSPKNKFRADKLRRDPTDEQTANACQRKHVAVSASKSATPNLQRIVSDNDVDDEQDPVTGRNHKKIAKRKLVMEKVADRSSNGDARVNIGASERASGNRELLPELLKILRKDLRYLSVNDDVNAVNASASLDRCLDRVQQCHDRITSSLSASRGPVRQRATARRGSKRL